MEFTTSWTTDTLLTIFSTCYFIAGVNIGFWSWSWPGRRLYEFVTVHFNVILFFLLHGDKGEREWVLRRELAFFILLRILSQCFTIAGDVTTAFTIIILIRDTGNLLCFLLAKLVIMKQSSAITRIGGLERKRTE